MTSKLGFASFMMRLALAATYISAYSSRINLFGNEPDGWQRFLAYASEVNAYAPESIKFFLAVTATALEIAFSILLLIGFKTRIVAVASGILTFTFAMAMTYSYGIKEPLDYGVFVNTTAAFLLATVSDHKWSLDQYLQTKKLNK